MTKNEVYRIEQLEKNYDKLNESMLKLLTNHLPHIQEEMVAVKTRMNILTAVNIGGIILGLIAAKFL